MSPVRRRSARLASASAVKSKATPELSSVAETHETPSKVAVKDAAVDQSMSPSLPEPTTPASSAVKPPRSEMHPSRYHSSCGLPSSALRLGFSDVPKDGRLGSGQDATPSKVNSTPASDFEFRFVQNAPSSGLSNGADQMMDVIKTQAEKIKAGLVAARQAEEVANIADRPFAKPKGRTGRFSAAHMAVFKKMDSIENHPSAWRAQEGRSATRKLLKGTPTNARLDTSLSSRGIDDYKSTGKAASIMAPDTPPRKNLKRKANPTDRDNDTVEEPAIENPRGKAPLEGSCLDNKGITTSSAKRHKQHRGDDVTSTRPTSACTSSQKSDVYSRLAKSKKLPENRPAQGSGGHKKLTESRVRCSPALFQDLTEASILTDPKPAGANVTALRRRNISPSISTKLKSIPQSRKITRHNAPSAIPAPRGSQTPGAPRSVKEFSHAPLTTPRRRLAKQVEFTPDVVTAENVQNSPSPQRTSNFKFRPALKEIEFEHRIAGEDLTASHSLYPDLSPLKKNLLDPRPRPALNGSASKAGISILGSDHPIGLGGTFSSEFGASIGQSGVRQVNDPATSFKIPGEFPSPEAMSSHSNKENESPSSIKLLRGTAHGMQNKKRHRATSDDDESDSGRAAKKRKNEVVPEGQELLAPRLIKSGELSTAKSRSFGRTPLKGSRTQAPGGTPGRTPSKLRHISPVKRSTGLTMSRLNMLAQPKHRG